MFIFLKFFLKPFLQAEIPLVVSRKNNLLWHSQQPCLGQDRLLAGEWVWACWKTMFFTHMANRWDRKNFFKRNTCHLCYGCLEQQQQMIPVTSHQVLHALTASSRLRFHPLFPLHLYQATVVLSHTQMGKPKKNNEREQWCFLHTALNLCAR